VPELKEVARLIAEEKRGWRRTGQRGCKGVWIAKGKKRNHGTEAAEGETAPSRLRAVYDADPEVRQQVIVFRSAGHAFGERRYCVCKVNGHFYLHRYWR
jgi:hypothetical protein